MSEHIERQSLIIEGFVNTWRAAGWWSDIRRPYGSTFPLFEAVLLDYDVRSRCEVQFFGETALTAAQMGDDRERFETYVASRTMSDWSYDADPIVAINRAQQHAAFLYPDMPCTPAQLQRLIDRQPVAKW